MSTAIQLWMLRVASLRPANLLEADDNRGLYPGYIQPYLEPPGRQKFNREGASQRLLTQLATFSLFKFWETHQDVIYRRLRQRLPGLTVVVG